MLTSADGEDIPGGSIEFDQINLCSRFCPGQFWSHWLYKGSGVQASLKKGQNNRVTCFYLLAKTDTIIQHLWTNQDLKMSLCLPNGSPECLFLSFSVWFSSTCSSLFLLFWTLRLLAAVLCTSYCFPNLVYGLTEGRGIPTHWVDSKKTGKSWAILAFASHQSVTFQCAKS